MTGLEETLKTMKFQPQITILQMCMRGWQRDTEMLNWWHRSYFWKYYSSIVKWSTIDVELSLHFLIHWAVIIQLSLPAADQLNKDVLKQKKNPKP